MNASGDWMRLNASGVFVLFVLNETKHSAPLIVDSRR